jgi:PTH1 family peptidyl-tRNA hydrolase
VEPNHKTEGTKIRLVAGLGNPGPEYTFTRHNIGFLVLDAVADRTGVKWEKSAKWGALWTKFGDVILVKPMTYMNRSGEPLGAVARFHKVEPQEIFAVLDDFALPLGRLRLRPDGSSGGHNGLESILTQFGTEEIPRLRIGIGHAPGEASVDYVLGRFFDEERPMVESTVNRAADAVKCAIDNGLVSAMNTFNKAEEL